MGVDLFLSFRSREGLNVVERAGTKACSGDTYRELG